MYIRTPLKEIIRIDSLMTLHYFQYTKDFQYPGERHDFWEIVYIDAGEAGVAVENDGYRLRQGEAIFHKPNEYHNIGAHSPFACAAIFSFETQSPDMKFFEGKIIRLTERQRMHISEILKEGKAALADPMNIVDLERLTFYENAPFGTEQIIKTHLEQMLIDMIREDIAQERGSHASEMVRRQNESQLVRQIQECLMENMASQITLDALSSQVGFSKTYLKTLFKQNTGMGIMQMFNQMKIEEAKKLISQRRYLMTEISEMLGFNSVHYFSRCFKKTTGMTPSDYSKSVGGRALL